MFHLHGEVRLAMVKETEKNYLLECNHCYCAFHKHANSEVQKPTDVCIFHLSGALRKQKFTSMGSKGHGL